MEELKHNFRPEFLNRIDEIIVFHSLTQEDVKRIVDLMMVRLTEQLKAKDLEIELSDAAKGFLAEKGYDPSLGARPLRRTIQRLVEDPLSEKLLWKEFRARDRRSSWTSWTARSPSTSPRSRPRRLPSSSPGRPRARNVGSGPPARPTEDRWPGHREVAGLFGIREPWRSLRRERPFAPWALRSSLLPWIRKSAGRSRPPRTVNAGASSGRRGSGRASRSCFTRRRGSSGFRRVEDPEWCEPLEPTDDLPMTLLRMEDRVREELWPGDEHVGFPVVLPGGEEGRLVRFEHSPDGVTWSYTLDFRGSRER